MPCCKSIIICCISCSEEFSPNTTSDVAAALLYPFLSAPLEKTNVWGSRTYDILKLLAAEKNAGIEMTQTFEYFRTAQSDPDWMTTVDNFERISEYKYVITSNSILSEKLDAKELFIPVKKFDNHLLLKNIGG